MMYAICNNDKCSDYDPNLLSNCRRGEGPFCCKDIILSVVDIPDEEFDKHIEGEEDAD